MTDKVNNSADNQPLVKALHVAMGFATFAIVAVVLAKPASNFVVDAFGKKQVKRSIASKTIDMTVTGSITPPTSGIAPAKRQDRLYTVRRSVLQKSHEAPCVIAKDGNRTGDC